MESGFWETLKKPIIGLSPMDGVTDAACRYITDKYGRPDILFTEFTNVEGISHGAAKVLTAFIHHRTATPTVAQIFGIEPEAFYQVAFVIAEMGFDGIDINMGCPDKHIAKLGGGAGLILQPKRAQAIIRATQQAARDWAAGRKLEAVGLKPAVIDFIKSFQTNYSSLPNLQGVIEPSNILKKGLNVLPVSVKTRIGYDKIVTEDWITTLLEVEPVNISLHGRTLQQLYTGQANWEEIGKAAVLAHRTRTTLLGNGDIKNLTDAHEKIARYQLDGVLIGRAALGNPWIFRDYTASPPERLKIAIEHCHAFARLTPDAHFLSLRKHLAWYCKGFDHATDLRSQLMQATTAEEVEKIISEYL